MLVVLQMVDPISLLKKYPIISDQVTKQELAVILHELRKVLDQQLVGAVCELGCYAGTTSLFIQRLLTGETRQFHVYDSFAGLPEKVAQDASPAGEQFKAGELAVSKQTFIQNFRKANLPLPIIHKGWFCDLTDTDIPDKVAFAFLDGDYYESIQDSLRLIENRLVPGATIIIDDYANEALPGAAKATDEWLRGRTHKLRVEASLAVIHLLN